MKLKSWSGVLELQNMSLRDMERMTFDMGISDALRSSKFDIETHLNKIKKKNLATKAIRHYIRHLCH